LILVLADLHPTIEHIGSTAVPGLAAKAIIDIMVGIQELVSFVPRVPALEALGYRYRPDLESEVPERRFFMKLQGAVRTHHLHVVPVGSAFWADHLLFRDHLRSRGAVRAAYNRLKLSLAQQYREERDAYTRGKAAFIQQVLEAARDEPAV
jgi:GrpB-like predicted nucleotidyltransferase (UPF0157 family)